MFSKNRLFIQAVLILTCCLGLPFANAESQPLCYNLSNFHGTYSIVATYGANIAMALGTRTVDASGNMTGTFYINEPTTGSTTGARTIVSGTQVGTIAVNCDGTGVVTRVLTLASGGTVNTFDDFLVTGAIVRNGRLVITQITDMTRAPSAIVPGGIFVFRTWTRVPDWNDFLAAIPPLSLPR